MLQIFKKDSAQEYGSSSPPWNIKKKKKVIATFSQFHKLFYLRIIFFLQLFLVKYINLICNAIFFIKLQKCKK